MTSSGNTIVALATRVLGATFGAPSWASWLVLLKAVFGLPLTSEELEIFTRLTGRASPPTRQVREFWAIFGRRCGKTIVAALLGIYLACCRTYTLSPGEIGVLMMLSADRRQSRTLKRYISGLMNSVPALRKLIAKETKEAIWLTNGLVIEIHTSNFRAVRGYTLVAAICDEIAFWPHDDSANPDTEILAALRPAMSTVRESLLICITSPYAKRGEAWKAMREHYGRAADDVLVANAATTMMNPTISPAVIEAAYRDDPAHAAAEFGGQFRSDIESFITEDAIEAVVGDHAELLPLPGLVYRAGFDGAGGSVAGGDSQTLAIAHDDVEGRTVLDVVRERKPPFSPEHVIATDFVPLLEAYHVTAVTGDRWGGEWPRAAFAKHHVAYEVCEHSKSELYRALLPRINSGQVELRDVWILKTQLAGLERRTARGGKDSIDHRPGAHDDVINAAAIVLAQGSGACGLSPEEVDRLWRVNEDARSGATPTLAESIEQLSGRAMRNL